MEDLEQGKRRWVLYFVSVVYLGLTVWAGIGCSQGDNSSEFLGYICPVGFAAISILTLFAASQGYRGGLWFVASTQLAAISVFFLSITYDDYRKADSNAFIGGIFLVLIASLLAALMFWLGHRRHLSIRRGPDFEAVPSAMVTTADTEPAQSGDSSKGSPLLLYPPMHSWRVFLLMLLSCTFYSCFLMYRIARDIYELGERQLNPKHCAWQMLIPLYNFTVFLAVAKQVTRQAKASGTTVKVSSGVLMLMLILAHVSSFLMPDFLFLLSASLIAIPWLILNERMNIVRRNHPEAWCEPPNRYSWRQRFVLVAGAPIIVLALIGHRSGFSFYAADRLEAQQSVSGKSAAYQLTIPDAQWRQVPLGTLYPDTDLELLNQQMNEWVVVRALPSQQQLLDSFVDQRKAIIAANWKNFTVEETRAFISDNELIPLSLAQYTQTGVSISRDSPLFVATIVTTDQIFEVIGHGSNKPGSSARDLVQSFRLMGGEKKS